MPHILVLSSVNMDQLMRMPRCPKLGETVMGTSLSYAPGGKGANAAIAAKRLGAEVSFAGCVGQDAFGAQLAANLQEEGVDVTHLKRTDQAATGLAPILVEDGGQNRIIVYPGANLCIRKEDIPAILTPKPDALLMQLEIPREVILEAAKQAMALGIPVVLDAGPAQEFPLEQMQGIEILSPNETETTALTGMPVDTSEQIEAAAQALMRRSQAKFVVLKLGARGAYVLGKGIRKFVPAFKVQAVDPTAAGDSFTGALTLEYLRTGDILAATRLGCAAGAVAATKLGAQPSLPTMEQVQAFLRQ